MRGLVFDIEEFALYDGPGIRSVIFLKGCPLRCQWCHNPEGLSFQPQQMRTLSLCRHCGLCKCDHPCTSCGACVLRCPAGCLRIAGTYMTAEEVAVKIERHAALLSANGGGITFSGGEALSQAEFVLAVRKLLPGIHACIETSGYAPADVYQQVAREMNLVIQDIKLLDPAAHRHYTGVDNACILQNIRWLVKNTIPFRIRVPLIPTVNDDPIMMKEIVRLLEGAHALEKVELLPYNTAAGAKYAGLSMEYKPQFPVSHRPDIPIEPFKEAGIPCDIL